MEDGIEKVRRWYSISIRNVILLLVIFLLLPLGVIAVRYIPGTAFFINNFDSRSKKYTMKITDEYPDFTIIDVKKKRCDFLCWDGGTYVDYDFTLVHKKYNKVNFRVRFHTNSDGKTFYSPEDPYGQSLISLYNVRLDNGNHSQEFKDSFANFLNDLGGGYEFARYVEISRDQQKAYNKRLAELENSFLGDYNSLYKILTDPDTIAYYNPKDSSWKIIDNRLMTSREIDLALMSDKVSNASNSLSLQTENGANNPADPIKISGVATSNVPIAGVSIITGGKTYPALTDGGWNRQNVEWYVYSNLEEGHVYNFEATMSDEAGSIIQASKDGSNPTISLFLR